MILILLFFLNINSPLSVTVTGIEEAHGQLVIAIYNSGESFMNEDKLYAYRFIEVDKVGGLTFELELPNGQYAISLYHDLNGDGKLNTNLFGVPQEPYGFSNNARGMFSAPKYSEAVFDVKGATNIRIRIE